MKLNLTRIQTIIIAATVAAVPMVAATQPAYADKAQTYTGRFSNLAVQGYDPVAYFTDGKPVKGEKEFTTTYQGAEYRFASAENLAAFTADPARFAPQYGGYCAWAVSQGKTAKGDAKYWAIVDDKLYLNFNRSIQKDWDKDREGFITAADQHWPTVLEE
ncbi:MAG: YHS domain-containing protein [Alphaproteobacteria bacterium]|nr:YHS domain-containing protein [Alphaproteobacteria bacterium]